MTASETATYQVYRLDGPPGVDQIDDIVPLVQITLPEPPRLSEVRAALVKIGLIKEDERCETKGEQGLYFVFNGSRRYQVWQLRR